MMMMVEASQNGSQRFFFLNSLFFERIFLPMVNSMMRILVFFRGSSATFSLTFSVLRLSFEDFVLLNFFRINICTNVAAAVAFTAAAADAAAAVEADVVDTVVCVGEKVSPERLKDGEGGAGGNKSEQQKRRQHNESLHCETGRRGRRGE